MRATLVCKPDGATTWVVIRGASIYMARNGKEDVRICTESPWGARRIDGKLYRTCKTLAAESGEVIRSYEATPAEITIDWLRQNALID